MQASVSNGFFISTFTKGWNFTQLLSGEASDCEIWTGTQCPEPPAAPAQSCVSYSTGCSQRWVLNTWVWQSWNRFPQKSPRSTALHRKYLWLTLICFWLWRIRFQRESWTLCPVKPAVLHGNEQLSQQRSILGHEFYLQEKGGLNMALESSLEVLPLWQKTSQYG